MEAANAADVPDMFVRSGECEFLCSGGQHRAFDAKCGSQPFERSGARLEQPDVGHDVPDALRPSDNLGRVARRFQHAERRASKTETISVNPARTETSAMPRINSLST